MITKEENKQYVSPCIEAIEMENESVLCQSGGSGINSLRDNYDYGDLF